MGVLFGNNPGVLWGFFPLSCTLGGPKIFGNMVKDLMGHFYKGPLNVLLYGVHFTGVLAIFSFLAPR